MYAQVRLSDHTIIGTPGPLPYAIAAWAGADDLLADLTSKAAPQFGFDGMGFWPVVLTTPTYDPNTQALDGTSTFGAPDPINRIVPANANVRALTMDELAAVLSAAQAAKITDIETRLATIMTTGAPASGLHIALSDSARADMGGMATTAIAALSGALPWPDSYKLGWITIENARIPLATPTAGLQLAAGVGDYYARCRQNARNLKDATLAATSLTAVAAIDVTQGWPPTA